MILAGRISNEMEVIKHILESICDDNQSDDFHLELHLFNIILLHVLIICTEQTLSSRVD